MIDLIDNSDKGNDFDLDKENWAEHIEPKYKVGDVVTNCGGLHPNVKCIIAKVDIQNQCYFYKEVNGSTSFKDQDKLILVNNEEVPSPVEDEDKLDILAKAHADNVKYNVLKYNIEHYPLIYNVLKTIINISKEGGISYRFIVPMKAEVDESGVSYEEDEICGIIRWHFDKLGFTVKYKFDDKNNCTEFFISW